MSASIQWDGLAELLTDLRNLPAEMTVEGGHIGEAAANAAAVTVRSNYGAHRHTGHLQDSVVVEQRAAGQHGFAIVVKATAKHAHLFESGTQARHTASGANRGVMPPAPPVHAFIPAMIRHRRTMYERLKDLLRRTGASVTGDA